MSKVGLDINVSEVKKLIKDYFLIPIHIKGVECRVEDVELKVVIGFNEFEIVTELFPCNLRVLVSIICQFEKLFNIPKGNL